MATGIGKRGARKQRSILDLLPSQFPLRIPSCAGRGFHAGQGWNPRDVGALLASPANAQRLIARELGKLDCRVGPALRCERRVCSRRNPAIHGSGTRGALGAATSAGEESPRAPRAATARITEHRRLNPGPPGGLSKKCRFQEGVGTQARARKDLPERAFPVFAPRPASNSKCPPGCPRAVQRLSSPWHLCLE